MPLDFEKLASGGSVDTVLSPGEIFRALPAKDSKFEYPRDVQAEVLDQWFERRNENDIVIKMNTGSGKTLVGLLLLKSRLNEGQYPVFYVAPDTYLARQVLKEAKDLGIAATDDPRAIEVLKGQAICVINIYKLVNGKSIFGVGQEGAKIKIANILIDDAHACLSATEGQFTLTIDAKDHPSEYKELFSLFREDLSQQSEIGILEIESQDPTRDMRVPYWAWINKQKDAVGILYELRNDDKIQFVWPLIKDHLYLCRCVIGGGQIEISPKCLPIDSIPSFIQARNRVYMSATLSDDNILVSDFNVNPASIMKLITPKIANDIGDRMILVPQELTTDITDDEIKSFLLKLSKHYNVVVIVPSNYRARYWKDVSAMTLTSSNLHDGIEKLKQRHLGLVVMVNKYDGIDLPNDACRILVIDGIPDVRRKIDKIEQTILADSEILLSQEIHRIEQGMGRGIRAGTDQCVVFLMGASLVKCLFAMNAQTKFSTATKAQIDLSSKVANQVRGKSLNELEEVINYCLNRDPRWLKASRGALVSLQYIKQGKIDSIVLKQREAFGAAAIKQFSGSIKLIQEAINAIKDKRIKGWLKVELAEYTHHLDPGRSQEILKSALNDNPRVLKPLEGITYTKLSTKGLNQAKLCSEYLKIHCEDSNKFIISLNGIIDELQFRLDSHRRFEQAMKDLASLIGFVGQRPEVEFGRGPDVLWGVGELRYFAIECKNEATSSTICKRDCDQMSGAIHWFNERYDRTCTCIPIIIHPANVVEYQATPNPDMKVINVEKLELLKSAILNFGKNIAYSRGFNNYSLINRLLEQNNLSSNKFIATFTSGYLKEKK